MRSRMRISITTIALTAGLLAAAPAGGEQFETTGELLPPDRPAAGNNVEMPEFALLVAHAHQRGTGGVVYFDDALDRVGTPAGAQAGELIARAPLRRPSFTALLGGRHRVQVSEGADDRQWALRWRAAADRQTPVADLSTVGARQTTTMVFDAAEPLCAVGLLLSADAAATAVRVSVRFDNGRVLQMPAESIEPTPAGGVYAACLAPPETFIREVTVATTGGAPATIDDLAMVVALDPDVWGRLLGEQRDWMDLSTQTLGLTGSGGFAGAVGSVGPEPFELLTGGQPVPASSGSGLDGAGGHGVAGSGGSTPRQPSPRPQPPQPTTSDPTSPTAPASPSGSTIPEPAALAVLAVGGAMLRRRPRAPKARRAMARAARR